MIFAMKRKTPLLLAALASLASTAFSDPVKVSLTNDDATALYAALDSLKPGLSPDNTGLVALDLNALRPVASAHDRSLVEFQTSVSELQSSSDPKRDDKILASSRSFAAFGSRKIIVDLEPLVISKEEMKPAQVSGHALSLILEFLSPPPKK